MRICRTCCIAGNATVAGQLRGCNGTGVPGTVQIKNGGTTLWSGSTDGSGNYTSASIAVGGGLTLSVIGTPTSTRFAATTVSYAISPGANTGKNISASVASGYICGPCALPVPTTLFITVTGVGCNDASGNPVSYPSDTLTYATGVAGTNTPVNGWYGSTQWAANYGGIVSGSTFVYEIPLSTGLVLWAAVLQGSTGPLGHTIATGGTLTCVPFSIAQTKTCVSSQLTATIHE